MNENLKIDEEFKNLIPPLSNDEKHLLEQSLIEEGCREAICIWNGYIIDGHNRYEICKRLNIPFSVRTIPLTDRDEVVSWICANQLGRRNISEATKRYLIGKRYEAEKKAEAKNEVGINQYTRRSSNADSNSTAHRLGDEYHVSHQTVLKYGAYAKAIDDLNEKSPDLGAQVLNGNIKIAHNNLLRLSRMKQKSIDKIESQMTGSNKAYIKYSEARDEIGSGKKAGLKVETIPEVTVKQMPEYDPDAELASLSFTVPSWVSSMERVIRITDLSKCSNQAKSKALDTLLNLKETADQLLDAIIGD